MRSLLETPDDAAALVLRIALGIVMVAHGLQKLLGAFGGPGLSGTLGYMHAMHIPTLFAMLAIAAETAGALGLIVGFLGRVAAFGIACEMFVAVMLVHRANGFFMNWSGQQHGEGFEFHILVIAIAIAVMIRGSGRFSIDRAITAASPQPIR